MKEEKRPWGLFRQFVLNKKCTVKIIEIKPRQELSLQIHKKRKEKWYFLTPGVIQIKERRRKVREGELIEIQKNIPHRILSGNKPVKVLEISFGDFKEDDEIRLEDKYNR
ncbi:MAG: mannose-6-phosphate isomerase [Candidatus Pacearchaeota archaeon]|nr:mannose-6-phosphate isomerase [Candidatus Pacearchaeota archaeon]